MGKFRHLFLLCIIFLCYDNIRAQGCSDAGFCSIGNHVVNEEKNDSSRQKLSLLLSNGIGDEDVFVFTPSVQYDNQLSKRWAIQARLTANYASGNLGNAAGAGDLFLSVIHNLPAKKKWRTSFFMGTKLPLNNGDIHEDGKPLPMQYQSSLGTVDLLAGISVSNVSWSFSTAVQQPLTGTNRNTFLPAYWNNLKANAYIPSNDFNRKGDVLLKAAYTFNRDKKIIFNIGLLGIYHLGEDTYIDGNASNKPIKLRGSDGLTLNGTGFIRYAAGKSFLLGLSGGVPFIVRKIRPDGLTRAFVLSPEIIYHF